MSLPLYYMCLYSFTWIIIIIIISWPKSLQICHRLTWAMCKKSKRSTEAQTGPHMNSFEDAAREYFCFAILEQRFHFLCNTLLRHDVNIFIVLGDKTIVVVVVINLEWPKENLRWLDNNCLKINNPKCLTWWDSQISGWNKVEPFVKWRAKSESKTEINSSNSIEMVCFFFHLNLNLWYGGTRPRRIYVYDFGSFLL